MSFPVSMLSALLPPSLPAVQATAQSLGKSTAQAFGSLLQNLAPTASGLSEPNASSQSNSSSQPNRAPDPAASPADRLRARLADIVAKLRAMAGLESSRQPVHVIADGSGVPTVEGPPEIRQRLQQLLDSDPNLVGQINAASRDQQADDPMQWLPGGTSAVRWTIPSSPTEVPSTVPKGTSGAKNGFFE